MPKLAPPLSSKQRRHLRSLGHHLEPVVQVGKEGVTEAVVAALEQALLDHELVKVRLGKSSIESPEPVAEELADRTGGAVAQVLGNTMLIYRPHPEKPSLKLP